ncbi:MAG: NADH-quinone oxidoreductase subunit N [Bacteroidota bacterium]
MDTLQFSVEALGHSSEFVSPILVLLGVGLVLMLLDAFEVRSPLPWIAAAGLIGSSVLAWFVGSNESQLAFFGMMETGGIAPLVHIFLCMSALFTLFFLQDYLGRQAKEIPDVYSLMIFAVIGMILLANANDLIMSFIGLETMSICLYIFAALYKTDVRSNEAGLKYFLLGSFASTFLLFGISIIYGITGYTNLTMLSSSAVADTLMTAGPIFYVACGLILVGLLFKVSAFPFHMWTPDVYTGTPTPLTGLMSTGSKMAAFIALGVVMEKLNFVAHDKIVQVIALSALFTMIYGNIVAARQDNLKRMLAYSSVAHAGYVLLGLAAASIGFKAVLFYMFIYTLMNIGAFGMIGMAEKQFEDTNLDHWKGLGKRAPLFAGAMSVFLFSLAGIPPLAGFMSKYQVFSSAIREDLIFLATIGILASVIGAFYYIRVIVMMFFQEKGEDAPSFKLNYGSLPAVGIGILVLLVILFGIFPSLVLEPINTAFHGEAVNASVTALGN